MSAATLAADVLALSAGELVVLRGMRARDVVAIPDTGRLLISTPDGALVEAARSVAETAHRLLVAGLAQLGIVTEPVPWHDHVLHSCRMLPTDSGLRALAGGAE